jgi:predicted acetyltransferase
MELVWPAPQYLAGYADALRRGWSPDNVRPERASENLARIAADPQGFLAQQVDKEAKGPAIRLPDGVTVPRLPGYSLWMWDGEFCGSIGFRWHPAYARAEGLAQIDLTTTADNIASQRVIDATVDFSSSTFSRRPRMAAMKA